MPANTAGKSSPKLDVLLRRMVAEGASDLHLAARHRPHWRIDGDIMPIADQLVQTAPHALHSLDPQGNVDMAKVKQLYGHKVCLIGNVNCGLLDTGTDEEVVASARYALENGMPGGGYIFSTSNCVYTGMRLRRYELMLEVWRHYAYPEIK